MHSSRFIDSALERVSYTSSEEFENIGIIKTNSCVLAKFSHSVVVVCGFQPGSKVI